MNEQLVADLQSALVQVRKGWTQGSYSQHGTGKVCLVGATRRAVFGDAYGAPRPNTEPEQAERYNALLDALLVEIDPRHRQLITSPTSWTMEGWLIFWNDRHDRRKRHVKRALRNAIRKERKS